VNNVFIIAEAGVNHNGSLDMALRLIDAAKEAGADAVKFQTFKSEAVISLDAPKAEYQKTTTGTSESQLDMVRKLELSAQDHEELLQHCKDKDILFLSTPFDEQSADLLVHQLKVPQLKVPSGELTNAPFLLKIASYGLPVIVSSGMSTLGEIELALGVLAFGFLKLQHKPDENAFRDAFASDAGQAILKEKITLLQCTTEYPAAFSQVNLKVMDTLHAAFELPVGLSDHTPGYAIPLAAVARGAVLIEKHFTLDRNLPGPDHMASLEPHELKAMVDGIRQVSVAIGSGCKRPAQDEIGNRTIARRSLVAKQAIKKGEIWNESNLTCKRPGDGVSPYRYWDFIGQPANRDYRIDEKLDAGQE
jgi:N-acetylneuraminate synthase